MRFLLLANPDNRRVSLFKEALAAQGLPSAEVLSYADLLGGRADLGERLSRCDVLRIESPAENFEVFKRLVARGAYVAEDSRIEPADALALPEDFGRVYLGRQWYLGWRSLLQHVDRCLGELGGDRPRLMNAPEDIALLFDKPACQARLAAAGVDVPAMLGQPANYDDLRDLMAQRGINRVFLKPAHGSSASGVAAYRVQKMREQAITSAKLVQTPQGPRLYNSLAIQRYEDPREIRQLVDLICAERAHAERWIPKASAQGGTFDLRMVVIGGRCAHSVVRIAQSPMTNLHLGNRRGDLDRLVAQLGAARWQQARRLAERAAACFDSSLYVAVDMLVATGMRTFAVCEANAFGDLLPRITWRGMSTYEAEISALLDEPGSPP